MSVSEEEMISKQNLLVAYYDGYESLRDVTADDLVETILLESESVYHRALAYYVRGVLKDKGNDASCVLEFYEALRHLSNADTTDLFIEIQARKNIGVYMMERGFMTEAIDLYTDALPYAEKYKEKEVYSLLYNLGNVYNAVGHANAPIYYDSVESYAKRAKDYKKMAQVSLQKGLYLENKTKNGLTSSREPISYYMEILAISDSLGERDKRYVGMAYHALANKYVELEMYDSALLCFDQAIELEQKANRLRAIIDRVDLLHQLDQLADKRYLLAEALNSINDELVYTEIVQIFEIAKEVYKDDEKLLVGAMGIESGFLALSLARQQEMIDMKERLLFDKTVQSYKYELEKKELERTLDYNTLLALFLAALMVIAALVLYMWIKRRQQDIDDAIADDDKEVEEILKKDRY